MGPALTPCVTPWEFLYNLNTVSNSSMEDCSHTLYFHSRSAELRYTVTGKCKQTEVCCRNTFCCPCPFSYPAVFFFFFIKYWMSGGGCNETLGFELEHHVSLVWLATRHAVSCRPSNWELGSSSLSGFLFQVGPTHTFCLHGVLPHHACKHYVLHSSLPAPVTSS